MFLAFSCYFRGLSSDFRVFSFIFVKIGVCFFVDFCLSDLKDDENKKRRCFCCFASLVSVDHVFSNAVYNTARAFFVTANLTRVRNLQYETLFSVLRVCPPKAGFLTGNPATTTTSKKNWKITFSELFDKMGFLERKETRCCFNRKSRDPVFIFKRFWE